MYIYQGMEACEITFAAMHRVVPVDSAWIQGRIPHLDSGSWWHNRETRSGGFISRAEPAWSRAMVSKDTVSRSSLTLHRVTWML